jgi:hypothetical protein
MKVLKAPELDSWSTEVTCKCTALLEIVISDISSQCHEDNDRFAGSIYYTFNVKCPICKDSIPILENKMTPAVKAHLEHTAKRPYISSGPWDR